jgi:hypothetical protein
VDDHQRQPSGGDAAGRRERRPPQRSLGARVDKDDADQDVGQRAVSENVRERDSLDTRRGEGDANRSGPYRTITRRVVMTANADNVAANATRRIPNGSSTRVL